MTSQEISHQIVALLPRLRRFARGLSGSADEADDLVQGACERALRSIDGWTAGTRLDSWMFRILRNLWIDALRKRRFEAPAQALDGMGDIAGEDGRRTMESRLELAAVRAAIATLPEEQRSVLLLVCVEGLSYREAAAVLDAPIGTIMSRLARARRVLADALAKAPGPSKAADDKGRRS